MAWTLIQHADADALAAAVAARIDAALDTALAERGAAVLALAGGRTSPPVFRRLAARRRDWSKVVVLPSDERWVPRTHPDCNLRQMQDAFAGADGIRWLPLVPESPAGAPDPAFAEAGLEVLPDPFDATLLGMGVDGHFGSLFPGSPNLPRALDPAGGDAAAAILPDPMPAAGPHPRVSLTLSRMLRSRRVLLAITGHDKSAVLEQAQRAPDPLRLPVGALLHAPGATIEIHWSP
ncbi:MAG: 6-phosphogluconolactonase [Xanthomonadaceae bacterium]|jgi:6-phosphogluconolactonase|nr:6-phosphogluconolactonase [Xanthomonadaceae bacterium]